METKWLTRRWLRTWHDKEVAPRYSEYCSMVAKPEAVNALSSAMRREIEYVWNASGTLLDQLESLPRCWCHLDAFRRNLFAVGHKTVAIDWAFTGWGAYGEDLAGFVLPTVMWNGVNPSEAAEFKELAFAKYICGLREAGWRGDEHAVRFSYLAHGSLRYSCRIASRFVELAFSEQARAQAAEVLGANEDTVFDWMRFRLDFLFSNHHELRSLSKNIR